MGARQGVGSRCRVPSPRKQQAYEAVGRGRAGSRPGTPQISRVAAQALCLDAVQTEGWVVATAGAMWAAARGQRFGRVVGLQRRLLFFHESASVGSLRSNAFCVEHTAQERSDSGVLVRYSSKISSGISQKPYLQIS